MSASVLFSLYFSLVAKFSVMSVYKFYNQRKTIWFPF